MISLFFLRAVRLSIDLNPLLMFGELLQGVKADCRSISPTSQEPAVLQVGFGVAVDYALDLGIDWIWERIQLLAGKLRSLLEDVEGITVHDRGKTLCGIVTFTKVSKIARLAISGQDANTDIQKT
jgi:hypothetical protein